MDMKAKLTILERMVAIYDQFIGDFDVACEKFCAHCCTANVTMTTLEGYRIFDHLHQSGGTHHLERIVANPHPDRFQPLITINRMADICARDGDLPEEHLNPAAGPCPILQDDACPLYPVRPFGCRCMVSAQHCGQSGFADMDPFILTVNDLFLQHLEHIDAQGYTGNFADVMAFLAVEDNRSKYVDGMLGPAPDNLVPNQPVFVLMIPPEHRERVQPILQQIRSIQV